MSTCTMPDCSAPLLARGFCRKHYLRWYRHGDAEAVKEHKEYAPRGEQHGAFVHGAWNHPLYKSWWHMIQRCQNPKDPAYKNYGARGISVCKEWQDVRVFIADMGERPPGGSLERRENSKGYSPENCIWASVTEQARNRRNVKLTTESAARMRDRRAQGATRKQLAIEFGVSEATVKKVISGAYWS